MTATFRASKGYVFSEDGTPDTTWAHFTHVAGSDPAAYEFETADEDNIAALRKLIDDRVEGYTDIVEVEPPARKPQARKQRTRKPAAPGADSGKDDPDDPADDPADDAGDDEAQNGD